ncbi:tRNA lysidine(34) synthetase TilS [Polaribacter batillariae]|uniref:tRNA(Ile)-lysidine synthase n=1 Tax=Polaribacter batillariae TaxID=2808900 RepID=A0ABX7SRA2_9FLAO|nr:tRNA lysidine(34) synthetase TilS [Polaribacter batillariae]QTD36752.1 tRNA lysidine(34) synthetase TilS [Polaribacter batillariae]
MLQKFKEHINKKFPFLKKQKILIAISGGVDSVVLTHLLKQLNFDISLAHCNFNLREKESDLDEEFVKNLSKKISIDCFTTSFETKEISKKNKESVQITARNLRYKWFQKLIKENNFDVVLTAHHLDDYLETFLINLTRGTGLEGFTGIPEINGNIVRPLLVFSREEIIDFAIKNNIDWREDKSNASTKYIRNKIRHQIIPVLKEINPSLLETFSKTVENLKESQQIIDDKIAAVSKEIILKKENLLKFNVSKIRQLSNPKAYLYQLLKKYNFTEWNDVSQLLIAQTGKQLFSKTHVLLKDRDFLILSKIDKKTTKTTYFIEKNISKITQPLCLTIEKATETSEETKNIIFVEEEGLEFPLIVRKWQNGDYFYPKGMQGKKKLSKYFKDEKMSLLEKEQTWLLCNNNNDIIWVIGKRQDRRFSVKNMPKTIKISLLNSL